MQDNYGKRAWRMQMTCQSSRSVFFEMELTPEQYLDMMTNRVFKANVSLNTKNVGKTMERRTVEITVDPAARRAIANVEYGHRFRPENDPIVRRHLLRLCKRVMPPSDGWVPNLDDFTNHHRRREDNRQAVSFYRFVDSPTRGTR